MFEKKKVLPACERSAFQLLDAVRLIDKGLTNFYKTTAKTHSTLDKKCAIPIHTEYVFINRCRWRVGNTRAYYTFEQGKFKKGFVIMNQVSRKNRKADVERDFYKLLNNSNCGYDYRNNTDNCFFNPIYDEIEELSYSKTLFNK